MNVFTHFPVTSISLLAGIIGAFLVLLIRKWVDVSLLALHHEVAFPIFLQIGVIYAVLLAFTFSMVTSGMGEAYKDIKIETSNLLTLAQLAQGFPEQKRQQIDTTLIEYAETVIQGEWPKMRARQEDQEVASILGKLQRIYLSIDVKTPREEAIYANSLEYLARLRENRRMRVFTATEPKVQNPLLLLTGLGIIVISISYLFGMPRLWVQMVLTGALIVTIVSILMVIYLVSDPFTGKFGITPRIFENTLIRLKQMDQENFT